MEKQRRIQALELYLSNLIIYFSGLLIIEFGPYFRQAFLPITYDILLILFLGYALLSPAYYVKYTTLTTKNKSYLALRALRRFAKSVMEEPWAALTKRTIFLAEEKVALLFILVKLFFLPLMVSFLIDNLQSVADSWTSSSFNWFSAALPIMFTIDTGIFTLGYSFESTRFHNIAKSVEPTLLGWAVALICYPPFNGIIGRYVPWGANDMIVLDNFWWTLLLRFSILGLLAVYVSATIALGFKASNLTNRGIVTKFPYSIVRHPAYASKVLMWWLTLMPVMTILFALGMLFWTCIYYLRAITEEHHLEQDPEYNTYAQKVKYRFIPQIW